jgi:tetratricopeptide (TPR) repeat protein
MMSEAKIGEPYLGTRPFRQADRGRFYGRTGDAVALADMWRDNHLTVAVGPVASGKTSLLRAGAYPLMSDTQADVLPCAQLSSGSTFPAAALPDHNPYTLAVLRCWSPGQAATRLTGLTVSDFVRGRARTGRHDGLIFAAIDQVEELPSNFGPRWAQAQQFMLELADAVQLKEPRLHLLLVIREDSVGILNEGIANGPRYDIRPLTPEGAIAAVTGPVAGTGRAFADGAAEKLVTDLQTSRMETADGTERYVTAEYVEPALLQAVCTRFWDDLPTDLKLITTREVRSYGDTDAALAAYCSQIIAAVADEHDKSPKWLRSWLLDTFVTDRGTRTSAGEGSTETAKLANAVLRSLTDRHLLTAITENGLRRYKLLSDRLIEPLRRAVDERPPPTQPAVYLRAAERALALGELGLAKAYAERTMRAARPGDFRLRAEACSLLGNLAREQGKPGEAADRYREAAELFEAVRDASAVARQLAAVGEMLAVQGRFADAVKELRAAADRLPHDPIVQTELALALWKFGEGRTAVAVLTATLGVDGGNLDALRARGEILADLGDARGAMLDLDRATKNAPPATRAARGLALAELGDQFGARREIDHALTGNSWNGPVLYYAARAAALTGDDMKARELAKRAVIATDPALPPRHRDLADRLAGNGTGALG